MYATIRPYKDTDAKAFLDLNKWWIDKYFVYEPSDADQLENPKASILDRSGVILIADIECEAIGTIALIPKFDLGDGVYELVKMSVNPDHYGKRIGNALMSAAIAAANTLGAKKIWLETNAALEAATYIYYKFGFRALSDKEFIPTKYDRCNLQMELVLNNHSD